MADAPDLSNIPSEDLQHIAAGDMSKVSTPTLNYLTGKPQPSAADLQARLDKGSSGLGGTAGRVIEGALSPLDEVASGVSHMASGVIAPPASLIARGAALATGGDQDEAARNVHGFAEGPGTYHALTPQGKQAENDVASVPQGAAHLLQPVADAISHGVTNLTGISPETQNKAAGVANDVIGSIPAGGLLTKLESAAPRVAASTMTPEAAASDQAATSLGFRKAEGPGQLLAGKSAGPALNEHNAAIGDATLNSEANVAPGTKPGYQALENGRQPAEQVYDRLRDNLPPSAPLDQQAITDVNNAGQPEGGRMSAGSPQAQQQIESLRDRLADPHANWTPQQLVNEMRGLRQEGYTNIASDDVSNQQLGRAQLDMARAVEGHVGRNLNANGTVSLSDFQAARQALAKNYTAQGLLRGDTYDLRALARVQQADPELLTGHMKTAADFAAANREVVGPTSPLTAPSITSDLAGVSLAHPASWVPPFTGSLGRRLLTGGSGVIDQANRFFGARGADSFPARVPTPEVGPPTPLAGGSHPDLIPWAPGPVGPETPMMASTPTAPAAAPPQGGISLADLLSHGVEHPPEPGLSLAPGTGVNAPAPQGLPFRADPGHMAGGLSLADELAPQAAPVPNGDHAGVMSQGVPEGIAQRTNAPAKLSLADLLSPDGLHPEPRKFSVNKKGKTTEEK